MSVSQSQSFNNHQIINNRANHILNRNHDAVPRSFFLLLLFFLFFLSLSFFSKNFIEYKEILQPAQLTEVPNYNNPLLLVVL